MTRRWGCAFAVLSILVVSASLSAAAEPPSKKITLSGRDFPTPVKVSFAAPAGYTSGAGGLWKGPRWRNPSAEGDASLTVNVGGDTSAGSAERAARTKLGSYLASWTVVATKPIAVPHLVGARKVGTFKGFFLILHNPDKGYEGWYTAAIGVSLGKGYPVLAANFLTTTPSDDETTTIEGKTPSVWNLQVIEQALRGMAVEVQLAVQPTGQIQCFGMTRTVSGTTGTAGADVIIGSSGNDTLRGLGGNDTICGRGGNDTISAGAGDDRLKGSVGDDRLEGGSGDDSLDGDEGDDELQGDSGKDSLRGALGNDDLSGDGGEDLLRGGPGDDKLKGGSGADDLYGDGGGDLLQGGSGGDDLYGDGSADRLEGGSGADNLYGQDGPDSLKGGGGDDFLDAGPSVDYLEGGSGADSLKGGEGNDTLRGGSGNDFVNGGGGYDDCGVAPTMSNQCE